MGKTAKTTKANVKKSLTKKDFDLAIQVSDQIDLEDVRLMGCDCQQIRLVGVGQKSFKIEHKTDSGMDEGTNRIFVRAHFVLETNEIGTTDKDPFAIIKATFLLIYKTDSLKGITNKAVEHFGNINGIYNAWPYWREFVQNTIVRMNLPPLIIPVFRIFAPPEPKRAKKIVAAQQKKALTKKKAKR